MTGALIYFGAVLLGLLVSLPALVQKQHWEIVRAFWKAGLQHCFWQFATSELGVVVVTYCNKIQGAPTIVAPTANQAAAMPSQQIQIFFGDGDLQAVIQHNWALPSSYPGWLLPQVWFEKSLGAAGDTFRPLFTFGLTNTNSVTVNKMSSIVGSGGTYTMYLRRGDGPYQ